MKKILQYLYGGLFILAGINHFLSPDVYLPLIPPYFPWPEIINLFSGAIEIVLGAGLMTQKYRRASAAGIILLLIAFIPAHIHHITMNGCVSEDICIPIWAAWIRLLIFQPLLIFWAYIYYKK